MKKKRYWKLLSNASEMQKEQPVINVFRGDHFFLSNFYPVTVSYDGVEYPSVEHAYQAAKTTDLRQRLIVRRQPTPGAAKRAGRKLFLRPNWDAVKISAMTELVGEKFKRPELATKLVATGDAELIEGNNWGDTFWGQHNGVGENHLGKILMTVRDELRNAD
jgi:ribA/ribD-fused uncharacterized protein